MSPLKVTIFLAVGLCFFITYITAEESKDNAEDEENTIKIYKRLIPADVLRGLYLIHLFWFQFLQNVCIVNLENALSSDRLELKVHRIL